MRFISNSLKNKYDSICETPPFLLEKRHFQFVFPAVLFAFIKLMSENTTSCCRWSKKLASFCFLHSGKLINMENRKEIGGEKRRRKIVARPVLVRSEKPGKVMSASYGRQHGMTSLWKAA